MGKEWDGTGVWLSKEFWQECYRVLKPGGHMLVWSIPRTSHYMGAVLEIAGFTPKDLILHCFGSGFPKSHNLGKTIQELKKAGHPDVTDEIVAKWTGWGTALKPAVEIWHLVRKPHEEANIASQVLKTGTGAINIDACRVKHSSPEDFEKHKAGVEAIKAKGGVIEGSWKNSSDLSGASDVKTAGRWPANLVLSHSPGCQKVGTKTVKAPVINRFDDGMKPFGEGAGHPYTSSGGGTEEHAIYECEENCPVKKLDQQSGQTTSGAMKHEVEGYEGDSATPFLRGRSGPSNQHGDAGGASRFFQTFEPQYDVPFFYTGKASKQDKNADLDDEERLTNSHPTVKAQSLMRFLVKLVTPPGGVVLDPFAGSGSTLVAAVTEGFSYIGIEREDEYITIARKRVAAVSKRSEEKKFGQDLFALMEQMSDED